MRKAPAQDMTKTLKNQAFFMAASKCATLEKILINLVIFLGLINIERGNRLKKCINFVFPELQLRNN